MDGLFNVSLGEVTPLTPTIFMLPLELGVEVNGDGEMAPRQPLAGAPCAMTLVDGAVVGGTAINIGADYPGMLDLSNVGTEYGIAMQSYGKAGVAVDGASAGNYGFLVDNVDRGGIITHSGGIGLNIYGLGASGGPLRVPLVTGLLDPACPLCYNETHTGGRVPRRAGRRLRAPLVAGGGAREVAVRKTPDGAGQKRRCTVAIPLGEHFKKADWQTEKHVPVIECPTEVKAGEIFPVKVTIGKGIGHPNTTEHHIRWVTVYFHPEGARFSYQVGHFEFSAHGEAVEGPNTGPVYTHHEVAFSMKVNQPGTLYALAFCNIHGLWEYAQEVKVVA